MRTTVVTIGVLAMACGGVPREAETLSAETGLDPDTGSPDDDDDDDGDAGGTDDPASSGGSSDDPSGDSEDPSGADSDPSGADSDPSGADSDDPDTTAGSGESGEPTADGWAIVDVGTDSDLVAVDFADAMHGWVVGADEILLHTDDSGASWSSQNAGFFTGTVDTVQVQAHVIQPGPAWGAYHLVDVHAVTSEIAWVASVGPLDSPPSLDPDHLSAVFVTDDAGATWTRLTLATNFQIWGVFGFDATNARAASIGGSDHPDSDIYRIEGGASQSSVAMTFLGLRDIAFFPDGTGVAVGSGGIFRASPGTDDWYTMTAPGGAWWSVAIEGGVATAVGEGGAIAKSLDGGATWQAQPSGTSAHLYGVSFADADHGIAVGDPGVVLRTIDGGVTWDAEDAGTAAFLNDVACTGSDTAWATGDGGVLLRRG